jgi:hypothetical protein
MTWSSPGFSQIPVTWQPQSSARPAAASDSAAQRHDAKLRREAWMLSVEGVTNAPIDWGLSLGLETPPGLRLSGGFGWVPDSYMSLLTNVAASASSDSGIAQALLDRADYDGHTWRAQIGFRPFRSIGLYADVGYVRLDAEGTLASANSGIAALEKLGGGYRAHTKVDMWLLQLGYQAQLADRLVLGLALGAVGTLRSRTTLVAVDGARESPLLDDAASDVDAALKKYGIVPTLSLRIGFDLI